MENEANMFSKPKSSHVRSIGAYGVGIIFIILVGVSIWASTAVFEPISFSSSRTVTIQYGASIQKTSTALTSEGIIRNAFLFRVIVGGLYPGTTLKAGEYRISEPLNLIGAAGLFVKGAPKKEITIRIIEGWTIADIANYLDGLGIVAKADFLSETLKDYSRFSFLPARSSGISLEGYLFPDTYRIYEQSTAADIIEKCLENFARQYSAEIEQEAQKSGGLQYGMHAIVTMASILEQEVQDYRDRQFVADIFYRRIKAGMPLQADSTINYITGKADPSARATDLAINSPYNTYRNKGMPPGPISNPGINAIKGALNPLSNPYWFFLTTPDGDVIYSKTFQEHVQNKIKYLSKKK
ncbi:MAG: endolytic transglycosylase MltG [Candidatus Uhrbacteria bacterium]|nr:endolytic transglycosylase MltG [Candidatus Uhrbacteria bacterium]